MDGAVLIGRLLLVSIYIFSGVMKFVDPSGVAASIAEKGLPAPELLGYAAGALEIGAGLAIAVGWMTAPAAIALAAFTLLAGVLFHDFWNYAGTEQYVPQMLNLFKNVAIAGGFLILAAFGPGRYALGHHRTKGETTTANPGKLGMA
jgi:putative oxidoreductase